MGNSFAEVSIKTNKIYYFMITYFFDIFSALRNIIIVERKIIIMDIVRTIWLHTFMN
jgi:hypothetical protein